MIKQAQTPLRKFARREADQPELDPANIGATLRELASRAHQLVREIDRTGRSAYHVERELRAVYDQIVRLERSLGAHQTDQLGFYVAALRERVQDCLAGGG